MKNEIIPMITITPQPHAEIIVAILSSSKRHSIKPNNIAAITKRSSKNQYILEDRKLHAGSIKKLRTKPRNTIATKPINRKTILLVAISINLSGRILPFHINFAQGNINIIPQVT